MLSDLLRRRTEERNLGALSWPDYLRLWEQFGFNGIQYVVPSGGVGELTALQAQRNPIVWACIAFRALVFSEVRFAFQTWSAGRPGKLFGTQALSLLEDPWTQGSTGELLARMEVDASLYGNSYWVNQGGKLVRLRPTRVTIATADVEDPDTGEPFGRQLVGYAVNNDRGKVVATFLPEEVAHYKPMPDPENEFRGISWMSALLPDIIADLDMSDFKHAFLQNAATPALTVNFQPGVSPEAAEKLVNKIESSHTGPQAGFKTLYLGAGADVKVVGSNFEQLRLVDVQQAGETRIAAAAGVPPTMLSLSESLGGSALNAGNYAATRRRFSDGTMRPLWRMACQALETLVPAPPGSRLWYDERDVQFLQDDLQERAAYQQSTSQAMLFLVEAGFYPDTIVQAMMTGDLGVLEHTGLVSEKLQKPGPPLPPGGEQQPDPQLPPQNGSAPPSPLKNNAPGGAPALPSGSDEQSDPGN